MKCEEAGVDAIVSRRIPRPAPQRTGRNHHLLLDSGSEESMYRPPHCWRQEASCSGESYPVVEALGAEGVQMGTRRPDGRKFINFTFKDLSACDSNEGDTQLTRLELLLPDRSKRLLQAGGRSREQKGASVDEMRALLGKRPGQGRYF